MAQEGTPRTEYLEQSHLNLNTIASEIQAYWDKNKIFERSVSEREEANSFIFFEGPPSANGLPGIHHVLGRTIKDLVCRFKTMKGHRVERRSGWDTHGLPVELQVEKRLGIKKEDIGVKLSVAEYNEECRKDVLQFQDSWEALTRQQGYWVDLEHPYITYKQEYIETVWWMLKKLHTKNALYEGYTIQPYSPAAGTGLSSHELNMPGAYREVKDLSCVAMFEDTADAGLYYMAWTTTPWTLPSNTALAVGDKIEYVEVATTNPHTQQAVRVVLAKALVHKYFIETNENQPLPEGKIDAKNVPWQIVRSMLGSELVGKKYKQLMPYIIPEGNAFEVIAGDFVSTSDGTGIVHIAPTFGADDMRVAQQNGIASLTVEDPNEAGGRMPLVDRTGKFVAEMGPYAGRYVKNYRDEEDYVDVNVDIVVQLKKEGKCWKSEKYDHSYPHCWRTDKPVIYYPMRSWFIRTTAYKQRMLELNEEIQWKPSSTGTGRFANWLSNLVDWNLSRTRYWGTPLPIWKSTDASEVKCIGSIEELIAESEKAVALGLMSKPVTAEIDLHRPYVDEVILASSTGAPMKRVEDVIDVWFDSGAMPYAQWHYPFENEAKTKQQHPADFIAEGVDQTRGWFFTLHALSVMLFDQVAFKSVISNGLVLDKMGQKMSKRLGNSIEPSSLIQQYGADAVRYYMVHNAQPWDNLKFDIEELDEMRKKLFGTLHNVYGFFALYANIDGYRYVEQAEQSEHELDRWLLSQMETVTKQCEEGLTDYEPTKAARALYDFVIDDLSNWYIRLCRRRFWKGDMSKDKLGAYQTLYICLERIAQLMAPLAPFYAEHLYRNLNLVTQKQKEESVHLTLWPVADESRIDAALEHRMRKAQLICSLALGLRKKAKLRVRQALAKVIVPVRNEAERQELELVSDIIATELNVKQVETIAMDDERIEKRIKADFKKLGPVHGQKMKLVASRIDLMSAEEISKLEADGSLALEVQDYAFTLLVDEVQIWTADVPGWVVAMEGGLTVALDINLTEELIAEGIVREVINGIQKLRKQKGLEVTDKIALSLEGDEAIIQAVEQHRAYLIEETLAESLQVFVNSRALGEEVVELEGIKVGLNLEKIEK